MNNEFVVVVVVVVIGSNRPAACLLRRSWLHKDSALSDRQSMKKSNKQRGAAPPLSPLTAADGRLPYRPLSPPASPLLAAEQRELHLSLMTSLFCFPPVPVNSGGHTPWTYIITLQATHMMPTSPCSGLSGLSSPHPPQLTRSIMVPTLHSSHSHSPPAAQSSP
jgi:hypothetical protein